MPPSWFEAREESLPRRAALLPLDLAALAYGAGARLHRALYARGWWRRVELGCRVVSVGSLVAGGSGKTPLAAWIAAELKRRGHRVVLASGGYGGRGRDAVEVVSDGRFVRSRAERAGDEPLLLAAHAPGVPVLVGRDRTRVGMRAVSAFGCQILVLDDGFQHHRLDRDLDLLALDGAAGLGNRRVLPRGPLREPPSALGRAHAIAVLDAELGDADEALLARHAPSARRFRARRVPSALRPLAGGASAPLTGLEGRPVGILAGIGQPDSLRRSVESLGARVAAERRFPDHHRYRPSDLAGLADETRLWITTEKDAVKILPDWAEGADLRVLAIQVAVDDPRELLEWIEERLRRTAHGRDASVPARQRPA